MPKKSFMDNFGKDNPPAPWNLLLGLKLGGFTVRHVYDTWVTPEIPPSEFIGPRWLVSAAIEDTGGAASILQAIDKYYPNCKTHGGGAKFQYDLHSSAADCMQTVLDTGLEILTVHKIGPDEDDESYVILKVKLPLQTVSQHEMAKVILAEHGIKL